MTDCFAISRVCAIASATSSALMLGGRSLARADNPRRSTDSIPGGKPGISRPFIGLPFSIASSRGWSRPIGRGEALGLDGEQEVEMSSFTVLRRLDCVLAGTNPAVLAELQVRTKAGLDVTPSTRQSLISWPHPERPKHSAEAWQSVI